MTGIADFETVDVFVTPADREKLLTGLSRSLARTVVSAQLHLDRSRSARRAAAELFGYEWASALSGLSAAFGALSRRARHARHVLRDIRRRGAA